MIAFSFFLFFKVYFFQRTNTANYIEGQEERQEEEARAREEEGHIDKTNQSIRLIDRQRDR